MNDRIDELLLGHELPVAIFTSYRDASGSTRRGRRSASTRRSGSRSPRARRRGRRGAVHRPARVAPGVRASVEQPLRRRRAPLHRGRSSGCAATFAVDNVDALWDHLFEIAPTDELAERLAAYFDLRARRRRPRTSRRHGARGVHGALDPRGRSPTRATGPSSWSPAASTGRRCSGLGRRRRPSWPEVPRPPEGAAAASYLVPYSFRRLDAFDRLPVGHAVARLLPAALGERARRRAADGWSSGGDAAARAPAARVHGRPDRGAHLRPAALARLRGHAQPGRTDVLDGLASALITDELDAAAAVDAARPAAARHAPGGGRDGRGAQRRPGRPAAPATRRHRRWSRRRCGAGAGARARPARARSRSTSPNAEALRAQPDPAPPAGAADSRLRAHARSVRRAASPSWRSSGRSAGRATGCRR